MYCFVSEIHWIGVWTHGQREIQHQETCLTIKVCRGRHLRKAMIMTDPTSLCSTIFRLHKLIILEELAKSLSRRIIVLVKNILFVPWFVFQGLDDIGTEIHFDIFVYTGTCVGCVL